MKGIIPKTRMLCFFLINIVILNLLCVWIEPSKAFFSTCYIFGSCFRTQAVILVSRFFLNYLFRTTVFGVGDGGEEEGLSCWFSLYWRRTGKGWYIIIYRGFLHPKLGQVMFSLGRTSVRDVHPLKFSLSESTHKGVTQAQPQRPESPTVTLTWHACKYKVH